MSAPVESQFEDYCNALVVALGHADRHQPARLYLKGLMLPGERKSVEPMAARVCPENVRSAHQSMNHLVAAADWSDFAKYPMRDYPVLAILVASDYHQVATIDGVAIYARNGT